MAAANCTQPVFHGASLDLRNDLSAAVLCQEGAVPLGLDGDFSTSVNLLSSGVALARPSLGPGSVCGSQWGAGLGSWQKMEFMGERCHPCHTY